MKYLLIAILLSGCSMHNQCKITKSAEMWDCKRTADGMKCLKQSGSVEQITDECEEGEDYK